MTITIDDFKKMEIRIGTIIEAARVPETDRLVRFVVDMGDEKRVIISGVALHYPDPAVLIGRQVPVLANLEPRTIKGEESKGMILYAIESGGKLTVLSPSEQIENGSVVR
ncbi:MAG: hypothetical protein AAB355_02015 [Patescibacteria group bacterium]